MLFLCYVLPDKIITFLGGSSEASTETILQIWLQKSVDLALPNSFPPVDINLSSKLFLHIP